MELLWNITKTETPNHTHYNIKLTWLGTIVLFPIWFPLFVLYFIVAMVIVIFKAIRG